MIGEVEIKIKFPYSITVLIASFVLRFSVQISAFTSDCSLSQLGHSFLKFDQKKKRTVSAQIFVQNRQEFIS